MLSSCATPPNFTGCTDLGDEGYCRKYMTKEKIIIDRKHPYYSPLLKKTMTWEEVRATGLVIPIDDAVELKNYFDEFCHRNKGICANGVGDWQGFATDLIAHARSNK